MSNEKKYFQLGIEAYKKGNYEIAMDFLRNSLSLNDNNSKTWNAIGTILTKTGKIEEAIESFQKALSLDPNNIIYQKNLSIAKSKKEKNAINDLNNLEINLPSNNPILYLKYIPVIFFGGLVLIYILLGSGLFVDTSNHAEYNGMETQYDTDFKQFKNSVLRYEVTYPNSWEIRYFPKDYMNFESIGLLSPDKIRYINIQAGDVLSSDLVEQYPNIDSFSDEELTDKIMENSNEKFSVLPNSQYSNIEKSTFHSYPVYLIHNFESGNYNGQKMEIITFVKNKIWYFIGYIKNNDSETEQILDSFTII